MKLPRFQNNVLAWGTKALEFAAEDGRLEIATELLKIFAIQLQAHAHQNKALSLAVKNGHLAMVNTLLEIEAVRNSAHDHGNYILALAAQNGDLAMVSRLLKIDKIRNDAHTNFNEALYRAAQRGHLAVLDKLLEIPEVEAAANVWDNRALDFAAQNGHLDIVNRLLKIAKVKHAVNVCANKALRSACKNGHLQVVNRLLDEDKVRHTANDWYNEALSLAAAGGHWKIVEKLFTITVVAHSFKADQILDSLTKATKEPQLPFSILQRIITQVLHLLGRPSLDLKLISNNAFLLKNELTLAPISIHNPYGLSRMILDAYTSFIDYRNNSPDGFGRFQNQNESSMDDQLLLKANETFSKVIRPAFQETYEGTGSNTPERLKAIETKIRLTILQHIRELATQASSKTNETITQFIDANASLLAAGDDEDLMNQARQLFTSNTIPAHVAWRCYDAKAPNTGWANLFVSPPQETAETPIFTNRGASEDALTLQQASDRVRERAAYYYLLIEDEKDPKVKADLQRDFIFYLAEIKRAHNESTESIDDPSCFPGTLTRLARIVEKSSQFRSSVDKEDVLHHLLVEAILKHFEAILRNKDELEAIKALFHPDSNDWDASRTAGALSDAITGIHRQNALDILMNDAKTCCGYTIEHYTDAHAQARQAFLKRMLGTQSNAHYVENAAILDPFVLTLEEKLKAYSAEWFISDLDRKYIEFFLVSLSEPAVLPGLGEVYSRVFPPTPSSQAIQLKEASNPFEAKANSIKIELDRELGHPNASLHKSYSAFLMNFWEKKQHQSALFQHIKCQSLECVYPDEAITEAVCLFTDIPKDCLDEVKQIWVDKKRSPSQPSFFSQQEIGKKKTHEAVSDSLHQIESCKLLNKHLDLFVMAPSTTPK